MEEIWLAQEQDEVLQEVKLWVEGDPPTKQALRGCPEGYHDYFKQLQSLHFNDGRVLMLKYRGETLPEDQRDRIVIPDQENLWQKFFYPVSYLHNHRTFRKEYNHTKGQSQVLLASDVHLLKRANREMQWVSG